MNSKPKVLLVEDDPFMTTLLVEGLVRDGLDVLHAKSGEEAVKEFSAVRPDVLLIDILLPGKNGLEALREIRGLEGGAHVPALMLSNIEEASYVREAEALGVKAYLVKANMQITDIVAKVREALKAK